MFTEAQKTAYQSMTAPAELRGRVLQMAKEVPASPVKRKRPVRRWMGAAVAACLVLVASVNMLLPRGGDVTLQLSGMPVTETATPFSMNVPMTARALAAMSLPVTVETEESAEIRVSHGMLLAADGTEITAVDAGTTTLHWVIQDVNPDVQYTLSVYGEEATLLTLAFDATENCWTVSATKE